MTNTFIAYTRVSTVRQGTQGVSLSEQRYSIERYAGTKNLTITHWYEEQQTAAKRGRPVFDAMLEELKANQGATGLLLHKVDRGARNLRDWASIGEAIDLGVEVRFAHDDFDLTTRGGRLAADIQAVIAADYIRNLREEVRKGIAGRLRQGLCPYRAPRGYLDCGSGQVKAPDPIVAPLIVAAFERYATGAYSLQSLAAELAIQGLLRSDGSAVKPTALSRILKNRFYVGELEVGGQRYPGIHQPLVTKELFGEVQVMLRRRGQTRRTCHRFRYQRQLTCRSCGKHLIGELQKTWIYYRCHSCPKVSVREDRVSLDDRDARYVTSLAGRRSLAPYQKFESMKPSEIRSEFQLGNTEKALH